MRNTLLDLNNHLFAEIERLSDEDITGEALDEEMKRAKAICGVSAQIVDNGRLILSAERFRVEWLPGNDKEFPAMLGAKKDEEKS